jgi:hypothetical protein
MVSSLQAVRFGTFYQSSLNHLVKYYLGWRIPAPVPRSFLIYRPNRETVPRHPVRLKAMMMRSMENTIYFASVNYALRFQESATSLIAPSGQCQAYLPYGQEGVLVQAIQVEEATGLLATRYAPERYQEFRLK